MGGDVDYFRGVGGCVGGGDRGVEEGAFVDACVWMGGGRLVDARVLIGGAVYSLGVWGVCEVGGFWGLKERGVWVGVWWGPFCKKCYVDCERRCFISIHL